MRFSLPLDEFLAGIDACSVDGSWSGQITGIANLKDAKVGDLSFLGNSRYTQEVEGTGASVVLLPRGFAGAPRENQVYVRVENPSLELGKFCRVLEKQFWPRPPSGIHPSAIIDRDANVDDSASVGPYCVVSAGARIGPGAVLASHVSLGSNVVVGRESRLMPHVTVGDFCELGDEVLLNPGVVIGSDGFGYETVKGVHEKVPQIGRVVIEDHVEIGANTTIDRARFSETRIGAGTKIDNLVQIGHNVRIGKGCLIVAQVGISGSTTIEDYVVIGGQTGIVGHITIGSGTRIGAQSGISKSIPAGSAVQGAPALDLRLFQRITALQRRLPDFFARFQRLEESTRIRSES